MVKKRFFSSLQAIMRNYNCLHCTQRQGQSEERKKFYQIIRANQRRTFVYIVDDGTSERNADARTMLVLTEARTEIGLTLSN